MFDLSQHVHVACKYNTRTKLLSVLWDCNLCSFNESGWIQTDTYTSNSTSCCSIHHLFCSFPRYALQLSLRKERSSLRKQIQYDLRHVTNLASVRYDAGLGLDEIRWPWRRAALSFTERHEINGTAELPLEEGHYRWGEVGRLRPGCWQDEAHCCLTYSTMAKRNQLKPAYGGLLDKTDIAGLVKAGCPDHFPAWNEYQKMPHIFLKHQNRGWETNKAPQAGLSWFLSMG